MVISDLLQQGSVWIEATTRLDKATMQLAEAESEIAPIFSYGSFSGLFIPSYHWSHIINFEFRARPVGEYVQTNFPRVNINTTTIEMLRVLQTPFIIVVNDKNNYLGYIDREKALPLLQPRPETSFATSIIDSLKMGIVAIDLKGIVILANPTALNILNLNAHDLIGVPISVGIPQSSLLKVLSGHAPPVVKIKNNEKTFFAAQSPILTNGIICGAVSVFQSISNLEMISSELEVMKDVATEFSVIFENSYDGIYITDGEGKTLRVNKAYERITGLNRKHLLGKNMKEIVKKGLLNESITFKIKETGTPMTIAQKIHGGKEILVSGTPVFNDKGELSRVISNVRDMTELNSFRRQLKKSLEIASQYEYEVKDLRAKQWVRTQLIYSSKKMEETIELALRVARVDSTVLIKGESGAGKEIIANIIHKQSQRSETGAFIKINCGAIPGQLLESELFGYEEGAFTGAKKLGKPGMFELANNGTLFLDEIADLPHELQGKLLRVLQFKEIIRVGGTKIQKINIRLITATSKNLEEMMKKGEFRNDLYYRLNVVPITSPALRERADDILPLVVFYLDQFNKQYDYSKSFSNEAMEILTRYQWPGNVRELVNLIERLVVTTPGDTVSVRDLPSSIPKKENLFTLMENNHTGSLKKIMDVVEKETLMKAFKENGSSIKAASALKISQSSIMRKARKHNMVFKKGWGD